MEQSFRVNNFFVRANLRKAIQEGRADYIPCLLSEVPGFFRRGIIPLDAALIQVSPADRNGYVVTEHGVACLYGKPLRERMRALIAVAAPEHRADLAEDAFRYYGISV